MSTDVSSTTPTSTETQSKAASHAGKYLTFCLGHESYGLEVLKVREIIKMQEITPVPQMPEYVKGVINLRGKIIPVIDLRIKFNLQEANFTEATCIIVVQILHADKTETQMGLIVDGVEDVLNITTEEIEDSPDFGTSVKTQYMLGMAKIKGSVKMLLDIDKVIGMENIEQLRAMAKQ